MFILRSSAAGLSLGEDVLRVFGFVGAVVFFLVISEYGKLAEFGGVLLSFLEKLKVLGVQKLELLLIIFDHRLKLLVLLEGKLLFSFNSSDCLVEQVVLLY